MFCVSMLAALWISVTIAQATRVLHADVVAPGDGAKLLQSRYLKKQGRLGWKRGKLYL